MSKEDQKVVEVKLVCVVRTGRALYYCTQNKGNGRFVGVNTGTLDYGAFNPPVEMEFMGPHDVVATNMAIKVRLPKPVAPVRPAKRNGRHQPDAHLEAAYEEAVSG